MLPILPIEKSFSDVKMDVSPDMSVKQRGKKLWRKFPEQFLQSDFSFREAELVL